MSLRSDNLCAGMGLTTVDIGSDFFQLAVVMPRYTADLLNYKPSLNESMLFLRQMIDAVTSLHKIGVLHLDIKLANIFIDSRVPAAYLGDFGLSLLLPHPDGVFSHTRRVSDGYTPPELGPRVNPGLPVIGFDLSEEDDFHLGYVYSKKTDYFSLGRTFFFISSRVKCQDKDAERSQKKRNYLCTIISMLNTNPLLRGHQYLEEQTDEDYREFVETYGTHAQPEITANELWHGKIIPMFAGPPLISFDRNELFMPSFIDILAGPTCQIQTTLRLCVSTILRRRLDTPLTVLVVALHVLLHLNSPVDTETIVTTMWLSLSYVNSELLQCKEITDLGVDMKSACEIMKDLGGIIFPANKNYVGDIPTPQRVVEMFLAVCGVGEIVQHNLVTPVRVAIV